MNFALIVFRFAGLQNWFCTFAFPFATNKEANTTLRRSFNKKIVKLCFRLAEERKLRFRHFACYCLQKSVWGKLFCHTHHINRYDWIFFFLPLAFTDAWTFKQFICCAFCAYLFEIARPCHFQRHCFWEVWWGVESLNGLWRSLWELNGSFCSIKSHKSLTAIFINPST